MAKGKLFFGGIPTEPEVKKLIEALGIPAQGALITYDQINAVLGYERILPGGKQNARWRGVVNAWLKRLDRQHNLRAKSVVNEGYRILTNSGRVTLAADMYKGAIKMVGRSVAVATTTARDGLDAQEKRTLDHIQANGAALALSARTAARQLQYPEK